MPVEDRSRFTSAFGKRDIDNGPRDHWGIDFGGPSPGESVFVKAAADGVVEWIKTIPLRSGPAIGIRHADGSLTAYLHTRRHKVKPGQKVKRGEVIAETWHTGIPLSNGIHLHFEWWKDYRDHRSVFNPIQRLAANGWVIRDGRLYDEQPATLNPAASKPTPAKDWFDMATEEDLKKIVRDEIHAALNNDVIDVMRSGQIKKISAMDALQNTDGGMNKILGTGLANAGKSAAIENAVSQLATGTGVAIDYALVQEAARAGTQEAIAAGIEVEGTVELKQKEA